MATPGAGPLSVTGHGSSGAPSASALLASDERFNQAYEKALQRKKLFKDYLSRHQVLEKFNRAMEALYELGDLPDDPMPFLIEQLKVPPKRPASYRPSSAAFKRH